MWHSFQILFLIYFMIFFLSVLHEILKLLLNIFMEFQIIGDGFFSDSAIVSSLSEQTGLATVLLHPPSSDQFMPTRFSDSVQVPISRLKPPANKVCWIQWHSIGWQSLGCKLLYAPFNFPKTLMSKTEGHRLFRVVTLCGYVVYSF